MFKTKDFSHKYKNILLQEDNYVVYYTDFEDYFLIYEDVRVDEFKLAENGWVEPKDDKETVKVFELIPGREELTDVIEYLEWLNLTECAEWVLNNCKEAA